MSTAQSRTVAMSEESKASGAAAASAADTATSGDASSLPASLFHAAFQVMDTHDPTKKLELAKQFAAAFTAGTLKLKPEDAAAEIPAAVETPKRPKAVKEKGPEECTSGSQRFAKHTIVHILHYGIDHAFDVILRFGRPDAEGNLKDEEFYKDWLEVANKNAVLYEKWEKVMREQGAFYGSSPAQKLWDSAAATKDDLAKRIARVYLVDGAAALDWLKIFQERFTRAENNDCIALGKETMAEQTAIVKTAVKHYKQLVRTGTEDAFQTTVRELMGEEKLKPIFNHEARADADLPRSWYEPLAPTETPLQSLIKPGAHEKWNAGAATTDHTSDVALAFLVERVTNSRFPMHLLERIVKMLPVQST